MKICHVTSLHSPDDARIFHKECVSLAKHHEVWLIAPNVEDYEKGGVKVVGVTLPEGRLKRLFALNKVYEKAKEIDADVYHFHDPELASIGIRMKRLGKTIIFDSHEDVPMQILTKEWVPKMLRKPLSVTYAAYEKRKLRQYDALVTVTPTITERLRTINPNTYQITNFPEYKELEDHRQWGRKICFTGGVAEKYMHHIILDAIQDIDVKYILAGPCNPESYMSILQSKRGWEKVDYRGIIKREDCVPLMQECMVGMAVLDYLPNVGYRKGTLGVLKIFEYMQAGIPIIATDFDLWKEIIEGNQCGICVNPFDTKAISDAIVFFLNHPDKAKEMGDKGKEIVKKHYSWESQEQVLFQMYEDVSIKK